VAALKARGQPRASRPGLRTAVALAAGMLAASAAHAQLRITPTFSAQLTLTDNRDLSATNRESDAIVQVSPGISMRSAAGPVQGSLDYSLNALVYASDSSRNTVQHALRALFQAEIVPGHAYVDGTAGISQQLTSLFGQRAPGGGLDNANTSEVYTASLSPNVRGRIAGAVDAQARLSWTGSRTKDSLVGDYDTLGATVGLGGRQGLFGWGLDGSRQVNEYKHGEPRTTQDTARFSVSAAPDPELQFSVRRGWEANDLGGSLDVSETFWGYGVTWVPTPRTTLALQSDRRFFGNSHSLSFSHRMARSVWSFTDSRGLSGGDLLNADARSLLSRYQQSFGECMLAFGNNPQAQPLCEALARASVGLDPSGTGGFLNSARSLQRSQTLSVAFSGLRSTVTVSGFRSQNERIEGVTYATGDLSQVDKVRQLGFTLGVSHRLTPTSSVALTASRQRTLDAAPLPGTDQRLLTASWSATLGSNLTGTITLRHTEFDSVTSPYNESALIGSVAMRF
jgi:uncharacterized protein (PEP-CTERM system associated)